MRDLPAHSDNHIDTRHKLSRPESFLLPEVDRAGLYRPALFIDLTEKRTEYP